MKKLFLILSLVYISFSLYAQKVSQINCRITADAEKELILYKVKDGKLVQMAKWENDQSGYFGFKFVPEYEGLYVLGNDKRFEFTFYIKAGDEVNILLGKDNVQLEGKNTAENKVLREWEKQAETVSTKAVRFFQVMSNYEDFFPDLEQLAKDKEEFKKSIKTKNKEFNEFMEQYVDYNIDYYAVYFLFTPRTRHPIKEERIDYYSTVIDKNKYDSDIIMNYPFGDRLLSVYTSFVNMEAGKQLEMEEIFESILNQRLRGELILTAMGRFKTYEEYDNVLKKHRNVLNEEQFNRAEIIGSDLYETREGAQARDFTYPDIDGKDVSLSDFKGKVVLVDVWATWCGPCLKEIPALKKLEEEMHGKDVVIMSVSVDVEKDHAKWKKMVQDEDLKGIQLFANGWSKITKDYKINAIPRFLVFDKQGRIVTADAPRPSNPELKTLLEQELAK